MMHKELMILISSNGAGMLQPIYDVCVDILVGNDRGTGNTVCFWPGVCWGTGAVLHFDTHTLTITSTGFYAVFGLTPDGVEARKFEPYHTRPLVQYHPLSTSSPPALATP